MYNVLKTGIENQFWIGCSMHEALFLWVYSMYVSLENSGEWEDIRWKSHQTEGGPSDPADPPHTSVSGSDGGSYSPAGLVSSGQGKVRISAQTSC